MSFFKVRNMVTNEIRMARYTTDYAASSYGIPALVLDDGQVADELWWELELEEPVQEAHRAWRTWEDSRTGQAEIGKSGAK